MKLSFTKQNIIGTLAFLLMNSMAIAQQNSTASGGDATGSGGSVSYSIGQIDYITETGTGGKSNQGLQQPSLPCPTVTSANVIECPGVPVNLVGTPAGGVFSIANPYLGPTTNYTYTYTDLSIGCTVTSAPSTVTLSNMAPAIPNPVITGTTVATISWTAVPGSTVYYIWYRPVASTSWITPSTSGTSLTLTGLIPNTLYEFKIRNNNAACSQLGSFGSVYNFSTNNAPCGTASTFITAFMLTNTTALVKWNALTNVAQYSLWYKKTSDASWSTLMFSGTTTQYLLTGLTPNTLYDVKIRNRCIGETSFSSFGSIYQFGTLPKLNNNEELSLKSKYYIFPIPTSENLNIEFNAEKESIMSAKLFDISGRLVKQIQAKTAVGLNQLVINLHELANGNYTLQLFEDNKFQHVVKITKQE